MRRRHYFIIALLTALVAIVTSGTASAEEALRCARFSRGELPRATPRRDRHALDRLQGINQAVRTTPAAVLLLGDSLTEGWNLGLWEKHLAFRGVLNAGISGDRTDHLLWRLENGNLAGPPPKALVLLIGTNDLGSGRSPELTADGIRRDLARLRQRLPEAAILLLALLPREEYPVASLRLAVEEVNRLIRDCADGEHIFYADIGKVLLDRDGRLTAEISPDRLHLSAHGYALITSRLDAVLDSLLATPR
jgi:lysophospholipase L1-like esterase